MITDNCHIIVFKYNQILFILNVSFNKVVLISNQTNTFDAANDKNFENNLDNAIGFFHIKDFIKFNENNFKIESILRDVLFVAPQSPILNLLRRMRLSSIHMGLVVDEFGGVDGLSLIHI